MAYPKTPEEMAKQLWGHFEYLNTTIDELKKDQIQFKMLLKNLKGGYSKDIEKIVKIYSDSFEERDRIELERSEELFRMQEKRRML